MTIVYFLWDIFSLVYLSFNQPYKKYALESDSQNQTEILYMYDVETIKRIFYEFVKNDKFL